MDNYQELRMRNSELQKEVWRLLNTNKLPTKNINNIRESFINNYCGVLQVAFQATVNPTELSDFIEKTSLQSVENNYTFIAKSIENPKAYEIVNEFLLGYIELYEATLKSNQGSDNGN